MRHGVCDALKSRIGTDRLREEEQTPKGPVKDPHMIRVMSRENSRLASRS